MFDVFGERLEVEVNSKTYEEAVEGESFLIARVSKPTFYFCVKDDLAWQKELTSGRQACYNPTGAWAYNSFQKEVIFYEWHEYRDQISYGEITSGMEVVTDQAVTILFE